MNSIILIGFMGCGKSSIGCRLSYRVQKTFLDTDKVIEKKQNKSITEIFTLYGEESFRQMETDTLKKILSGKESHIIAVGGGLPMREENRTLLKQIGTIVYLKVSAATIYERIKEDTTRPLLKGDNPEYKIKELLEQRQSIYENLADYVIEADEKDMEEIVNEMEQLLK